MDKEQFSKLATATAVFAAVVIAVFALWVVMPGMHLDNAAYAQEGAEGGEAPGAPGAPGASGAGPPPGAPGAAGGGMGPGMGPGGGGGGGPSATPAAAPAAPLEPSRANPFVPLDVPEPDVEYVTDKTKYGRDPKELPIGYWDSYPQPRIPQAPPEPIPPNPSPSADGLRVSSIVWPSKDVHAGAKGRAFATAEDPQGTTLVIKPGQRIALEDVRTEQVHHWRVVAIKPHTVVLQNPRTGRKVEKRIRQRSPAQRQFHGRQDLSKHQRGTEETGGIVGGRKRSVSGGASSAGGGMGGAQNAGGQEMSGVGGGRY